MHPAATLQFEPIHGTYVDSASYGLPPRATVQAVRAALESWSSGTADWIVDWDGAGELCRPLAAEILGARSEEIALIPAVSVGAGVVFAQLKCNDEILVPDDEFASVMLPALVSAEARGVTVRRVGFSELSSEVRGSTTIVATSHVRSRNGRVQDLAAVAEAASRVGAAVLVDATHSAGILPIWASRLGVDYVVCAAYKHLLCPRGVAFMSVREAAWGKGLPAAASWRSAADPYAHYYGPDLPVLSRTAAQYDVSLAWHAWVGAVPSLEFLRSVEAGQRQQWVVGLAKNLADRLGLPEHAFLDRNRPCGRRRASARGSRREEDQNLRTRARSSCLVPSL